MFFSGGLEGEDGDLWRAVEPEGKADGADAPVDVELHSVEAEVAFDVLLAHRWKDECSDQGQTNLAAVRVAGEHEVYEQAARMEDDVVGVVGLVGHEDDGCSWSGRDGAAEVGVAGAGVVDSAEPEAFSVALDGHILIDQDGSALTAKRRDDQWGADVDIVIAQDCVAEWCGEGAEHFAAAVGCELIYDERHSAVGDEVSGEKNEIGGDGVDVADDAFEKVGLGELFEVDIAELHDAVAVEGAGQIRDGDVAMDDVNLVACDFAGVKGQTCRGGTRSDEEVAPREARWLIGL